MIIIILVSSIFILGIYLEYKLNKRYDSLEKSMEEYIETAKKLERTIDKKRVEELFKSKKTYFYSDIALILDIELQTVVNICVELLKEGKIVIDEYEQIKRR